MEAIMTSTRYEIVARTAYHPASNSVRDASIIALRAIRDSGHYAHVRVGPVDTFGSKDAFSVQFNGMDGTLMIHDFSGRPELARQDVELLLNRMNLRIESHPDDLIEHGKPYTSWTPESLEVEL